MAAAKRRSSSLTLGLVLAICVVVVVVTLVSSKFLEKPPPPPPPPAPPPAANTVTGTLRYTEGFYLAQLQEDARRWELEVPTVADMARPLPYAVELDQPRRLSPKKGKLETPHLLIQTAVSKEWAVTPEGQSFRFEHVLLDITNKTDKHVAYLIATRPADPDRCRAKGNMPHNALSLRPGERIRRTECLLQGKSDLTVERVEVIELSEIGHRYVSRLDPLQSLADARTAAGHEPPKGVKPCRYVPGRDIRQSVASHGTTWADVIDFYARHNCEEYSFFPGYKRWTEPGALPARAVAVAAPQ